MEPDARTQIRLGFGACALALLLVLVLALVPDPLFRQHTYLTRLDNVAGIEPGADIRFRGASVGSVRSVELDPDSRDFTVILGISRQWRPGTCSQVEVSAANPLTAPSITLVALDGGGRPCPAVRAASGCETVPLPARSDRPVLPGCRRQPDLLQAAARAVDEAANVARTANAMALQLKQTLQGDSKNGTASGAGMAAIAEKATGTIAALNSLSSKLDQSLAPGRGDVAITLANLRKLSGRASQLDVAQANQILAETRSLIASNQASVAELLKRGAGSAAELHSTLEGASASLVEATANLDRISENLGQLSERLSADPTYVLHGQKFADPPSPGGSK
jgi:uncharacterized coiled-coil protein SlyX